MSAAGVVFFVVWMGDHFVASLMVFASQEFLEGDDTSDEEGDLGQEESLGGREGDDTKEQGNEGGDLQLGESEQGQELLDLLLFATSYEKELINE